MITYRVKDDLWYADTTAELAADDRIVQEVGAHAIAFDDLDKSYTSNGTNWLDDDTGAALT